MKGGINNSKLLLEIQIREIKYSLFLLAYWLAISRLPRLDHHA